MATVKNDKKQAKEVKELKEIKLNPFEANIKKHLDERAATDELFAVTYAKENKSIKECCNYVMDRAKKGGRQGYADKEVYGWAVHYYDEDDIKNVTSVSGKVIINEEIELTEEEKTSAKEKAIERFIEDEKKKVKLDYKVKLNDEDMKVVRERAIQEAVEEAKKKMLDKKKAKVKSETPATVPGDKSEEKVKEENQGSLF